jgi:hypothetical protein
MPILHRISIIRMRRTIKLLQNLIVLALGIAVGYPQGKGSAGGFTLVKAREDFYPVFFLAGGGIRVLAWAAPPKRLLNLFQVHGKIPRKPVNDHAYPRPMRLPKSRHPKKPTERIHSIQCRADCL